MDNPMLAPPQVTRFEVVDESGRVYVRTAIRVWLEYQDDGKTLIAHVEDREDAAELSAEYYRQLEDSMRRAVESYRRRKLSVA